MKRHFHPVAWCVIIGTFLSRAVFYMVYPYLAIYLHRVVGLEAGTIGLILGVSSLVGMGSSFFGGLWSDRFGRFPVLIGSILLWGLVFVGFASAGSAWAFFLLNAGNGLFRNLFEPTARALLADVTPPEERLGVFSARYYAINVGAAVGPLLGALLGSFVSVTPFYLTALVYALYGGVFVFVNRRYHRLFTESAAEPVRLLQALRVIGTDRFFRCFVIGNLFVCTAYGQMETTLAQYMGTATVFADGVRLFSFLMIGNAVGVLLLQIPLTKLAARFQPMTSVKVGATLFVLALLGFGCFHSLVPLLLSMGVFSAGEVLCFVVGDVVIDRHAPAAMRGTYFGASGLQFLGQSIGPWMGGLLLSAMGAQQGMGVFAILAGVALLALPMFWLGALTR